MGPPPSTRSAAWIRPFASSPSAGSAKTKKSWRTLPTPLSSRNRSRPKNSSTPSSRLSGREVSPTLDMPKILVIDDDDSFRQAAVCALQKKGFETCEAGDGAAGAELARRLLPDLIICDINMGQMDGYTLLETLRHEAATAAIPVILMTGMGDAASMRRGMNLGADDYLAKPFSAPQMFSAVDARLKQ